MSGPVRPTDLGHARSALRRAAADVRHATVGLRRVAFDLRNATLEVGRALYAALLVALPARAKIALRAAVARAQIERRQHQIAYRPPAPDEPRPRPKVVVAVPSRATAAADRGAEAGPVALLVAIEVGPDALAELVAEAERLAATAGLRPVFVTDSDAFHLFRAGGWLFEYVPPRDAWQERLGGDGTDYDAFVHARIVELAEIYRFDRIVALDGPGHLGRLAGLLGGDLRVG